MKINLSFPATGCQKLIEINDEHKVCPFYEKRMGTEVAAKTLGDEFKGLVLRITSRVKLLLSKGHSFYRPRRTGERKRKSVLGCIVDGNLAVFSMAIVKKGYEEIAGLTNNTIPRHLGSKRASKIRKLFNLIKDHDVRQYVVKLPLSLKNGKKQKFAAPKIQRLVTPTMLQRKRHKLAVKRRTTEKNKMARAEFAKILAQRQKETMELRRKRSASLRESTGSQ